MTVALPGSPSEQGQLVNVRQRQCALSEGAGVTLTRQVGLGTPLRISTLSWSLQLDAPWGQSAQQFFSALGGASQAVTPTLRGLVESRTMFGGGSEAPVTVIHVNSFFADRTATVPFSTVAFGDSAGRVQRAHGPIVWSFEGTGTA